MALDGIYKYRTDLDAIISTDPFVIYNRKGLKIQAERSKDSIELILYLDGFEIMSTRKYEHDIALDAVSKCPENGRCFIGGLGFGIVPQYLAECGKSSEVIIIERDKRVLEILAPRIEKYLRGHYPKFNFKIVEGDAYDEILTNGLFDWIFIDISDCTPPEFHDLSKQVLTDKGVFVPWRRIDG